MHRILLKTFVIDAPSKVVGETVAFWAGALGAQIVPTGVDDYTVLDGASPGNRIVVQDVKDGNRGVHFDLHTDDLEAEVNRLLALGATVVDDSFADHPGRWVIMRDPSGVEFCVVFVLNELRGQDTLDDFERRARPVSD